MKILVFAAMLVAASLLAGPAQAQTTGPTLMKKLLVQIKAQPLFEVSTAGDRIVVSDRKTGDNVFSLREINANTVTMTGSVGHLGKRDDLRQHIAMFNFSSSVGTLYVDEKTGEVTIEHHLNPRLVSVTAMADAANHFGQVARTQSALFHH